MYCTSLFTLALAALPVYGQDLHGWRQFTFGVGGTEGHWGDQALDQNPSTYYKDTLPGYLMILTNRAETYKGLYIQSAWPYITDYTIRGYNGLEGSYLIGQVKGARSNFTVVNFWDPAERPFAYTEWFQIDITGVFDSHLGVYRNTTDKDVIITDIYPIYADEEIVYPPGQTAQPIPTQTDVRVITQTSIPSHPGLALNEWPLDLYRRPSTYGGRNPRALVDNNPDSSDLQQLVERGYPADVAIFCQVSASYAGFYIISDLRDYVVTGRNMTTSQDFEVCRVTGATQDLTVCHFTNEAGEARYNSASFRIRPTAIRGDGTFFHIQEVYAIYPGDKIIKQEDL